MAELLAPAGNIESLDAAIGEGADAVYLGLKSFNARLRTSNFAWNQFEAAVNSLHRQNKKIYVTVNTVSEERDLERLYRFLSYLNKIGPDGLIVQDYAVVRMCQEFFPNLELHASTQMNIESAAGVNLLSKEGFKRVVLARELGLEEIKAIKAKTNTELEVFVHGALCVSESGLCLFSSFLGGKSANRGMCTQACRRFYTAEVPGGIDQGYYFSPCDLQLIDKIPDLIEAGVESFKIEGRMKSAEYVGSVVSAYRYLMDHYQDNKKEAVAAAKRMLSTDFARNKTSYWYNFKSVQEGVDGAGEQILNPKQAGGTGIYLGKIDSVKPGPQDFKMVLLKGGSYDPDPGDSVRLHKKDDTGRESHKVRFLDIDDKGNRWIDVPAGFAVGDSVYLLQTKSMSKRYPHVLPNDLSKFYRQPADEQLPILDLTPVAKNELSYFPEGIYIQVSSIEDIFVVQSGHPVRVIIELNSSTLPDLLGKKTVLPLSKKQIILSLDPFSPAGTEDELAANLDSLIELGFKTFIVNNVGHIGMLKGKDVSVIAGPYLYTFNRWAVSWLENQNIGAFISPYENSRHNLEATYDSQFRQRVLVPVFAYPALFRIRFKLPRDYDFTYFSDKENVSFKVNSTPDGSFVMPETPFSIIDKADFLSGIGFKRILIDFSKTKAHKTHFKQVMQALYKKQILPETSRFNWKDGFYSPEKLESYKAIDERRLEKQNALKGGRPLPSRGSTAGRTGTNGRGNANARGKKRDRRY
ncbi:U32 family peptidase [Treponema sp.]|uniref:U32 family peptidase n=1 Tax=Treponema sp. TaxID=166 RepID=UPI00298DC93C|nr:U32 family peptidase [Treponema sp.]MCR5614017.1 U32 family peptidase [Treponema sp.]